MKSPNKFIRKYFNNSRIRKNIFECNEQQDAENTKSLKKQQSNNDSNRNKNEFNKWMSAIDGLANEFDRKI